MAASDEKAPHSASQGSHKLLIIIVAIVAAAVIAVAAIVVLGGNKAEKSHGEAEKAEKGEKSEKQVATALTIYPLDPFIVNIYDGREIRYLKVKIEFELASAEAKQNVELKQSPLRDAILVLLTTKTLQDIQDLQGKNQLKEEILGATGRLVGSGKVTKVYFTDFVVQ